MFNMLFPEPVVVVYECNNYGASIRAKLAADVNPSCYRVRLVAVNQKVFSKGLFLGNPQASVTNYHGKVSIREP
jgi:hypothetical protein